MCAFHFPPPRLIDTPGIGEYEANLGPIVKEALSRADEIVPILSLRQLDQSIWRVLPTLISSAGAAPPSTIVCTHADADESYELGERERKVAREQIGRTVLRHFLGDLQDQRALGPIVDVNSLHALQDVCLSRAISARDKAEEGRTLLPPLDFARTDLPEIHALKRFLGRPTENRYKQTEREELEQILADDLVQTGWVRPVAHLYPLHPHLIASRLYVLLPPSKACHAP